MHFCGDWKWKALGILGSSAEVEEGGPVTVGATDRGREERGEGVGASQEC